MLQAPSTAQLKKQSQAKRNKRRTSFWFGEALVEVENHFLHKVLDVAVLWSSDKHHPVVGEALHSGFLSQLSTMTEF